MPERFTSLPGEVYIIGGSQRIIDQFDLEKVRVTFGGADIYELNPETGMVKEIMPQQRVLECTQFFLDPERAASLYFDIRCDFSKMQKIDEYIDQILQAMPVVDLGDAEISAAEIVHNAIKAAADDVQERMIQVSLLSIPEFSVLLISITDDLGRLNLDNIKLGFSDQTEAELMLDHGRGLKIVAHLMAGLGYNPANDGYKEIFFFVPLRKGVTHGPSE